MFQSLNKISSIFATIFLLFFSQRATKSGCHRLIFLTFFSFFFSNRITPNQLTLNSDLSSATLLTVVVSKDLVDNEHCKTSIVVERAWFIVARVELRL